MKNEANRNEMRVVCREHLEVGRSIGGAGIGPLIVHEICEAVNELEW
jgi:hypothetical protein